MHFHRTSNNLNRKANTRLSVRTHEPRFMSAKHTHEHRSSPHLGKYLTIRTPPYIPVYQPRCAGSGRCVSPGSTVRRDDTLDLASTPIFAYSMPANPCQLLPSRICTHNVHLWWSWANKVCLCYTMSYIHTGSIARTSLHWKLFFFN